MPRCRSGPHSRASGGVRRERRPAHHTPRPHTLLPHAGDFPIWTDLDEVSADIEGHGRLPLRPSGWPEPLRGSHLGDVLIDQSVRSNTPVLRHRRTCNMTDSSVAVAVALDLRNGLPRRGRRDCEQSGSAQPQELATRCHCRLPTLALKSFHRGRPPAARRGRHATDGRTTQHRQRQGTRSPAHPTIQARLIALQRFVEEHPELRQASPQRCVLRYKLLVLLVDAEQCGKQLRVASTMIAIQSHPRRDLADTTPFPFIKHVNHLRAAPSDHPRTSLPASCDTSRSPPRMLPSRPAASGSPELCAIPGRSPRSNKGTCWPLSGQREPNSDHRCNCCDCSTGLWPVARVVDVRGWRWDGSAHVIDQVS